MAKKSKKSPKDSATSDILAKAAQFNESAELPKGTSLRRLEPVENAADTPVEEWSCTQVADWLMINGFDKYADVIAHEHGVDGAILLSLSEADFRQKPLEMASLGDVKRLSKAIAELRKRNRMLRSGSRTSSFADDSDLSQLPSPYQNGSAVKGKRTALSENDIEKLKSSASVAEAAEITGIAPFLLFTRDELIARVESQDTRAKTLIKLVIAFIYFLLSLFITAFVMVHVHERVPDMKLYPPLPDIVLDNIPLIPWAFACCEMIGMCMSTIMAINLFFHKHRLIILRRIFSLVSTVFLLRCVTMIITSLSVPGVHLECKARGTVLTLWEQLTQAYYIWSRLGMSIQGVRSCGDYMFSGHTTVITLLNHFITEYTPDTWHFVHTATWVMNLFGIFFILAGHEHYSIDVFIAFYISSRLFLYYHAYAYNHPIVTATDARTRMWFPLGWFFEAGGHGRVENEYEFPISMPDFSFIKRLLNNKTDDDDEHDSTPPSPQHNKNKNNGSLNKNNGNSKQKLQ